MERLLAIVSGILFVLEWERDRERQKKNKDGYREKERVCVWVIGIKRHRKRDTKRILEIDTIKKDKVWQRGR